jgi:hypothetical protein
MLPIVCEEEAKEGSREDSTRTSAVVVTNGREETGCSCCYCLSLLIYP